MKKFKEQLDARYSVCEFAKENISKRELISYLLESENLPEDRFFESILGEDKRASLLEKAERVLNGEPLQYVCSFAYFYRSRFKVQKGVLIPRRDSEVLVETAEKTLPKDSHFLDLCTGSGCLAISILLERADLSATLVDISDTALSVARENAEALGVLDRCTFLKFDVLSGDFRELPMHSAIIMNPPYLTREEMTLIPENVAYEPTLALYGGDDGLDFYKRLFSETKNDARILIFEIGAKQASSLTQLFGGGEIIRDLSGCDRVFLRK